MAEQDFAQIEATQNDPVHSFSRLKSIVLTVASVAVVLGSFIGGFWLGREQGIEIASGEDKARLEKMLREQKDELLQLRKKARQKTSPEVSTTQVGELTFYNELPKQSIEPAPLGQVGELQARQELNGHNDSAAMMREIIAKELKATMEKKAIVAKTEPLAAEKKDAKATQAKSSYLLQVASFQQEGDAKTFIPKLREQELSAVIRRVELPKLGIWYRVYAGPFKSRKDADKALNMVKESMKITGLVVAVD